MTRAGVSLLAVLFGSIAACSAASSQRSTSDPIVAVAPGLFEFHSGMWLNLHHLLYLQARARLGVDPERSARVLAGAAHDTAGFAGRPEAERRAWMAALNYYATAIGPRNAIFDSSMVDIKRRLAELERQTTLRGSGLDPRLIDVLEAAAPVYRAVWWGRHDALNRQWVASMLPLLAQHGTAISAGLARAFDMPWPSRPIRVDVAAHTNWSGAYSTVYPSHIMIASTVEAMRGTWGLELLFHESSHTLEDSVDAARRAAASASGKSVSPDLSHAIIFYTTGELTRRAVPGHVPYAEAEGVWGRGMGALLPALRRHWPALLDGRITLREAMRAVMNDL